MIKDLPNNLLRLEFRFGTDEDRAAYGDGWLAYDEAALIRRPARDLMRFEGEIGAPLVDVLNGVRSDSVFGDTCAAWLALRLAGGDVAFADFSPTIMLTEWRLMEDEQGKAPTPEPEPHPDSDSEPIVLEHVAASGSDTPPTDSATS